MVSYIIRAARDEETNDGWVWMAKPSRTLVRIRRGAHTVFCQVRDLRDPNFLAKYNDPKSVRRPIVSPSETIVMAKWYRDALGGFPTTEQDNVTGRVDLDVEPLARWGWGSLRASCHHPDMVVRLGTRLGVLGAWLGIIGLVPAALTAFNVAGAFADWILLLVALLTGILGCRVCRGIPPPSA